MGIRRTTASEAVGDVAVLAGAGAVVTGLAVAWLLLGLIAGGALLISFAILWQLDSDRKARQAERDRHPY
jgi:hypothetical protein